MVADGLPKYTQCSGGSRTSREGIDLITPSICMGRAVRSAARVEGVLADHITSYISSQKSKPPQPGEESGPLHPSWAAKRKQSGAIASALEPAAGAKKIKFDEDGGALRPAPRAQAVSPAAPARGRSLQQAGALKPRPGVASPLKARAEKVC